MRLLDGSDASTCGFRVGAESWFGGYLGYCVTASPDEGADIGSAFDASEAIAVSRAVGEAVERNVTLSVGRDRGWSPALAARNGSLGAAFAVSAADARSRARRELEERRTRANVWSGRWRGVDATQDHPFSQAMGRAIGRRFFVLTCQEEPRWIAVLSDGPDGSCVFSDGYDERAGEAVASALREHLMFLSARESPTFSVAKTEWDAAEALARLTSRPSGPGPLAVRSEPDVECFEHDLGFVALAMHDIDSSGADFANTVLGAFPW